MATTLDVISHGRAICGLGAAWYDVEHVGLGFDYPRDGVRLDMLEEALQICRAMFTEETPSFTGEHYRIDRARIDPSAQVRVGAGVRFDDIEFNAMVQVVQITDDREAALAKVVDRVDGLTMEDATSTPYLLIGTVDEIVQHVMTCNERWGINYFAVRELDDFEPVLRALR